VQAFKKKSHDQVVAKKPVKTFEPKRKQPMKTTEVINCHDSSNNSPLIGQVRLLSFVTK